MIQSAAGSVAVTANFAASADYLAQMVAFKPATVPAAPTNLTAAAGNTQVALSWSAAAGATSYNIYRSTTSGTEVKIATNPATITTTSYIDTGLTNGTTYYYKVTAVNSAGESGLSGEVSAKPVLTVPAAPTNLTAAAGNTQVALSWSAATGATSYNIYRSTTSGTEVKIATNPVTITTASYTDTGLTNGTRYYYKVTAVNSAGESGLSSEVSATPTAVTYVQSASTGSDASAGTISQSFSAGTTAGDLIVVVVSWDTSAGSGVPTVTDSQGNIYARATYATDSRQKQALAVFYAGAVKGGAGTVTVNFGASQSYRRLLVQEYGGLAGTVDVTASNIASGSVPTSTSAVTTTAGDLIFGAFMDDGGSTIITAGAGFTQRQFTSADTASEDMIQSAAGSVAATANFAASTDYLAQMVAFKPGGTTATVTAAPTSNAVAQMLAASEQSATAQDPLAGGGQTLADSGAADAPEMPSASNVSWDASLAASADVSDFAETADSHDAVFADNASVLMKDALLAESLRGEGRHDTGAAANSVGQPDRGTFALDAVTDTAPISAKKPGWASNVGVFTQLGQDETLDFAHGWLPSVSGAVGGRRHVS